MPTPKITIPDASNLPFQVPIPPDNGRAAAADSRPTALCNEDKAVLDSLDAKVPALRNGMQPADPLGIPAGSKQLAVSSTVATLALTATCRRVSLDAVGAALRFTIDGTDPSASVGHYIGADQTKDFTLSEATTIKAIRYGTTDSVLMVTELT